jgi:hypothetical protein
MTLFLRRRVFSPYGHRQGTVKVHHHRKVLRYARIFLIIIMASLYASSRGTALLVSMISASVAVQDNGIKVDGRVAGDTTVMSVMSAESTWIARGEGALSGGGKASVALPAAYLTSVDLQATASPGVQAFVSPKGETLTPLYAWVDAKAATLEVRSSAAGTGDGVKFSWMVVGTGK